MQPCNVNWFRPIIGAVLYRSSKERCQPAAKMNLVRHLTFYSAVKCVIGAAWPVKICVVPEIIVNLNSIASKSN